MDNQGGRGDVNEHFSGNRRPSHISGLKTSWNPVRAEAGVSITAIGNEVVREK